MQLENFYYKKHAGWSIERFPELDSKNTLVIVFGGSEYINIPEPIIQLAEAYPQSHLVGCSSAGEIFERNIYDNGLSVAVVKFDKTTLKTATSVVSNTEGSHQAGEMLAKQLNTDGLQGVLVFSDGLQVNGTELVNGLNSELPKHVVVTGGLAADGDRFERTWTFEKNQGVKSGFIAAVGLYGDSIRITHGSAGGWDIFGPERLITRSEGNVLYEIDGQPALKLYKDYLGDRASDLPATGLLYPLAIREKDSDQTQLVRTILAVDEATQSMTFAGDMPQNWGAQLMKANFDRLIEGASNASVIAKQDGITNEPSLSIAISCVGRRLVLGERTEEEVEAVLDAMLPQTKQIGFYSYGEISSQGFGSCNLHNQTMTLTTLTEVKNHEISP